MGSNTQRLLDPEKVCFQFTASHSFLEASVFSSLADVARAAARVQASEFAVVFVHQVIVAESQLSLFCLQTICQKTPKDSAQYEQCKKALQAVSKVRGYY